MRSTGWLLLRGLGMEARHWRSFPERLAPVAGGGQILCLDLPGFGAEHARRSPSSVAGIVDDLRRRFADARGARAAERWSILGISLGGMVALDWCARHRDDFAACVIVNSSARPSPPFERFRLAGFRALGAVLGSDLLARERAVLRMTSNSAAADLEAVAEERARWRRQRPPDGSSFALQLLAAMRFQVPARVKTPVLVLASTADALVSHRCSHRLAAHLEAPVRIHASGGHDLSLDAPDWICDQIAEWDRPGQG